MGCLRGGGIITACRIKWTPERRRAVGAEAAKEERGRVIRLNELLGRRERKKRTEEENLRRTFTASLRHTRGKGIGMVEHVKDDGHVN